MALEDFTLYSEVDPNSWITKTSSRITFTGLERSATAYVNDNKGAAFFDGDFEHKFSFELTSVSNGTIVNVWLVANIDGDRKAVTVGDCHECIFVRTGAGVEALGLTERDGGTPYSDSFTGSISGTQYWPTIERDESVGTYGTIYLYLYDDSARTNLVDILSIAIHTSKKDYSRVYGLQSDFTDPGHAFPVSGYVENLDLQEAIVNQNLLLMGVG